MNHLGSIDTLCLLAIAVAAYMFHKVYVIVSVPSPNELAIIRARYQFIIDTINAARTTFEKIGAYMLAALALLKGTGKVAFITAGLTLAVGVVSGGCPSLMQYIFEFITKWYG
jgi:UDP-N-acetylglucosamine:LPS N-acetylglucosamine transferase